MSSLVLALLGCLHPALDSLPEEPRVAYPADYARWSREIQVLRQLETQVLIKATLITEELAAEQALTLSRARLEDAERYAQRRAERVDEASRYWVVVLTTDSPRGAEGLSFGDDADWRLRLDADGQELAGVSLEEITHPSAEDELLTLQLDPWSRLWRARFERNGDPRVLTLSVSGPMGQGRATWRLR